MIRTTNGVVVERTDKFRAMIESPVFGEFANGRELGVSGTMSAKYAEGTDEELRYHQAHNEKGIASDGMQRSSDAMRG